MKTVEIKPDIYWVGAIDWGVRDFHGYVTPNGTTYNNYLIMDEQITLVDTVKHDFSDDPAKIKNLVINHIEPDHASSIDKVMELAPDAMIYITEKGKKGLDRSFDTSKWKFKIVKTGESLSIGKYNLLGQHLATTARFDDEFVECASHAELDDAIVDYYANILMPFGKLIKNKIADIQKLGIEIDMIAPDHGIIWRSSPQKVIQDYLAMANGRAALRVAIIYDTMWHSTERMTIPLMQGIKDEGVDCKVIKLRATPMSAAIKEFWKSRGTLIGTPTLNNIMFPSVAEYLTHLRGLRPQNRITGAFGSYGWGGGAVKEAYEEFKRMGLEVVEPGMQVLYRPSPEDETQCYNFAREFAKKVKEYHKKFD
ncbi:MAG: beta-lactamase domain protein [Nitrospirae bacterium]|nr:beta-lactamase domain protein [Nitrospirota bacterium]